MKMLTAIVLMFWCSASLATDIQPETIGIDIIAVKPDGLGLRFVIPFSGTMGVGGKRMWECITEPYYAKSEDLTKTQDINLFSLCKIKITAENTEQNPAHLKIDFFQMQIPAFIKIKKDEVVAGLLSCIIYSTQYSPRQKPEITFVGKPEDRQLFLEAKFQYNKTLFDYDFSKPDHPVEHTTFAEQLDQTPSKITSRTILADASNGSGGRIVVRDIQIKSPPSEPNHYYRFEYYLFGVLQTCDTWPESIAAGKASITWSGEKNCTISLSDWLQVSFQRDEQQHWSFGRRAD